jgi:hypothetical protein
VKVVVREELHEVCPHCAQVIHEKGFYYDAATRQYFHRGCPDPVDRSDFEAEVDRRRTPEERAALAQWGFHDEPTKHAGDVRGGRAAERPADPGVGPDRRATLALVGAVDALVKFARDDGDDRPKTVCVDLDGTIAKEDGPFDPDRIGDPRPGVKRWLAAVRDAGHRVIVWTVRGDTAGVKKYLKQHDLPYDHVNENPDQPKDSSGKLIADVYVDNRALDARPSWATIGPEILRRLK